MKQLNTLPINDLWYTGVAWGKIYPLKDLLASANERPQSIFANEVFDALTAWKTDQSGKIGADLVELVISDLLIAEMPESSSFAQLEAGEWAVISQAEFAGKVRRFASTQACENGNQAAEIILTHVEPSDLFLELTSGRYGWITAYAALDNNFCALYFDSDT